MIIHRCLRYRRYRCATSPAERRRQRMQARAAFLRSQRAEVRRLFRWAHTEDQK